MKFRIEIVMLTQWLKRCVMAQKDKSRGGLWAAILQIRNKIEEIGLKDFIKTKRGQGYII